MNIKHENNNVQRGNTVVAFKAGFWYVISNFTAKTISFITTPIFARLMTPFNYGEFVNFANWGAILLLITGVELYETLNRAYYDFKDDYDSYISSVTFLGCTITATFYLLVLLFSGFFLKIVTIPKQYVHILFIFLFFSFCRSMYYARERTLYQYKSVAKITFLSLFFPTLISVFLVYFCPVSEQLSARLYGFYLTSALIGLYCLVSLLSGSKVFKWHYCKYALYLSVPLLMHFLSAQLLNSTNVIITKNVLGAHEAAIISLAGSATNIVLVLFQAISGALTTWIMDNLALNNKERVKKGSFVYIIFLALITIAVILLVPEIIYILGGTRYFAAIPLVPWLVFATFIQASSTVLTIILTYDKNVISTALYTGAIAIIGIIIKIHFLPAYGLVSLAYINTLVFILLFIVNYCLVDNAGYITAVHCKGIFCVFVLMGIFTSFSQQLYVFSIARYMFIGVFMLGILFLCYTNKNKINDVVKNISSK